MEFRNREDTKTRLALRCGTLVLAAILTCRGAALCFAQPVDDGPSDGTFGRGGFDLGWGKAEDDDEEKVAPTPSPTPTPTPRDDSFFNGNVEDSGRGDKL